MKSLILRLNLRRFLSILTFLAAFSHFSIGQQVTNASKPFVLGTIEEVYSSRLGEKRTLNIYLPEGYKAEDATKYPVVYLLDGSADEDFIHVVGLYQFNNFSWIDRVPKSIIVGIATVDRRRDFTFPSTVDSERKKFPTSGHSDTFIDFIRSELQPFVDKRFKTNGERTLIGQSFGGLLATEILFKKPELFNKYIIVSPSLWWDNASLLFNKPTILRDTLTQKTSVYIGVGKEGLTPTDPARVMEVDANLLAEKLKAAKNKDLTVHFDYLPNEDHATISHQAVFNALRLLFPARTH